MNEPYTIGIDVGGTNVKAVAVLPTGHVLAERQVPTRDDPDGSWKHDAKRLVAELESARPRPAAYVGVCAPGIAAADGKSIWWMIGKMDTVMGFEWTDWLGRTSPVPVYNDAQAALLGEAWCGAAHGARNAVLLTLGTGVGGAILCDGRLLRGHLGRAGHLGHLSLDPDGELDITHAPGSIELLIGNCTVEARSAGRFKDTRPLVEAYTAGDPLAAEVWLGSVKALAAHVAGLINAVDPEVVVIGGGIAQAGDSLFKPLAAYLDRFEWRPHGKQVRIVPAKLGSDSGALGAAYGAMLAADSSAGAHT